MQRYGDAKKFAEHTVALVIKHNENLRDVKLSEFLGKDLFLHSCLCGGVCNVRVFVVTGVGMQMPVPDSCFFADSLYMLGRPYRS